MSYITKKPEKLASAIYLITGFFGDQEPLKWRLRSLASDLVSLSLYLKDNFSREREQAGLEIRSTVLEIVSFLNVARNSNLISDMNHEIIHKEFLKYLSSLGLPAGFSDEGDKMILSSNFFQLESSNPKSETKESENIQKDKIVEDKIEPEKKHLLEPKKVSEDVRQTGEEGYLGRVENIMQNVSNREKRTKNLKSFGAVSVKKNGRQSIIINLLKRKKEIMIKDVSPLIHGCSEKTIQRELLSMVKSGILKKHGEKRWSKYSLA